MIFNVPELAHLARAGLLLANAEEASWTFLINAPIPATLSMADELEKLRQAFEPATLDAQIDTHVAKLDVIVGTSLGLAASEIETIRTEMADDPFLCRVRPRYPFYLPRQNGRFECAS